jgi:phage terminase small subunit
MKLKRKEREFLQTFVDIAHRLLNGTADPRSNGRAKRRRRSSKDAAAMRKQIRAARHKNVPVKQIAKELGVTPSYVYQLQK